MNPDLERVYRDALAAGLGEEGARVAVAVAQTEHGYTGQLGDQGQSAGTFQLYAGGQLPAYARSAGMSTQQAIQYLRRNPHAANAWALGGYLGNAIKRGMQQGLSGPALATHAQRTGQVSVSPERAGQNYAAVWRAGGPKVQASVQAQTGGTVEPTRGPTRAERVRERLAALGTSAEAIRKDISRLSTEGQGESLAEAYTAEDVAEAKRRTAERHKAWQDRDADLKAVEKEIRDLETGLAEGKYDEKGEAAGDPVAAERSRIALERDRLALEEARRKAAAAASPEEKRLAELEVRKAELAVQKAEADLAKPQRAGAPVNVGRTEPSLWDPETGGFQPNPNYGASTPMEEAQLGVSRQNADTSRLQAQAAYLQAQVAKGNLDEKVATNIFNYIVAQKAPVEEGGKLYVPGREPSNVNRQFYGESVQPYSVVDAPGFYGREDLRQYVRGPYPYGAGPMSPEEYNQRQAGTFQNASPPSPAGGPVPNGVGPAAGPAAGGFQPQQQAPSQMPALTPPGPQFGGAGALMQQQQALLQDTEKIRQFLIGQGYDPRQAEAHARRYVGAGRSMAQTPF